MTGEQVQPDTVITHAVRGRSFLFDHNVFCCADVVSIFTNSKGDEITSIS
jgi:hypothetical protein